MYVPQKSVLTYQFKAQTSFSLSSGVAIENAVASDLSSAGFTVQDFQITGPSLGQVIGSVGIGYTVQITMKIRTGSIEYADENDAKSIFDHFVYQETGNIPASVILDVKVPASFVPVSTGEAPQTGPDSASPGSGGSAPSFFDTASTFLEGLGSGAILTIGLVIVGIVLLAGWAQSRKLI